MENYTCPSCHCGTMFEDHGKMVCLNCGHVCSKYAAEHVQHIHSYTSYQHQQPSEFGGNVSEHSTLHVPQNTASQTTSHSGNTQGSSNQGCGKGVGCFIALWILILLAIAGLSE